MPRASPHDERQTRGQCGDNYMLDVPTGTPALRAWATHARPVATADQNLVVTALGRDREPGIRFREPVLKPPREGGVSLNPMVAVQGEHLAAAGLHMVDPRPAVELERLVFAVHE